MDARDFVNKPVPETQDGKILEKIYELQKQLIDGYVKIEGLPPYPIDVNTKKNQTLIKDFVGRVTEELAEGYESMLLIDQLCTKNKGFFGSYNDKDLIQCLNHLQNVSEEMADAMHFMVELLIYVNIQPEDILKYIEMKLGNNVSVIPENDRNNTLRMAMYYGENLIVENNDMEDLLNKTNLLSIYINSDIPSKPDTPVVNGDHLYLYLAASRYSHSCYVDFKKCLWDVTQHMNIARNCLKNKPWKQSQMMTDEVNFQKEIVESFISMMGAFYYIGIDDDTLYHIYFWKHEANVFRQNSKY